MPTPTLILLKRNSTANVYPDPNNLKEGELVMNTHDAVLAFKDNTNQLHYINSSLSRETNTNYVAITDEEIKSLWESK